MAYGDLPLDAPFKPNKGLEGGACNRQSCQTEPANYYNHGSHAWYCWDCANSIGNDVVNHLNWMSNHYPQCQHPMFEDRQMMNNREHSLDGLDAEFDAMTIPEHRLSGRTSPIIWDGPYREDDPNLMDPPNLTVYIEPRDHDGREEQRALFGLGPKRNPWVPRGRNLPSHIWVNGAPKPEGGYVTSEKPLTKRQKRRAKGKN